MDYLSPAQWVDKTNYQQWREFLKRELLHKRHYRSDWSGKRLTLSTGCEMHEGIITRAVVPLSVAWHVQIYHEFNCFLLLPEEHRPQPPSREWCVEHAYQLYGKQVVQDWFYGLPWKGKPPFQLY